MPNIARLRDFTRSMTYLVSEHGSHEATLLDRGAELLRSLVSQDDWLPDAFAQPSAEGYRQYLLHCDVLERFSVVSFVWQAAQKTPLHDHTTWGMIAQLRGKERCQEYAPRVSRAGFEQTGEHTMRIGDVDRVSPTIGDIHIVSNACDATSISIHVYGGNIGAIRRHVHDAETGAAREFVSGYHNASLPNLWSPDGDERRQPPR